MVEAQDWVSPPNYAFKGYGLFAAATVIEQDRPFLGQIVWEQDACTMSDNWAICVNPGAPPANTGTGNLSSALGSSSPTATVVTFTITGMHPSAVVQINPGDGRTLPDTVTTDSSGNATQTYTYVNPGVYNASASTTDGPPPTNITWTQVNISASLMPKIIPGPQYGNARGFAVYNGIQCTKLGLTEEVKRAQRRLMWTEERQVEYCLMSGQAGNFPYLGGWNTGLAGGVQVLDPGGGSVLGFVDALGWLEGELGELLGPQGIIHASRYLAPTFAANWQTQLTSTSGASAQTRTTTAGTKVVFGSGYPAVGPDGKEPATGTSWLYATGPIVIYRSPVQTFEVFAGTSATPRNTAIVLAERQYMIQVDCPILAVQCRVPAPPHLP